MKTILLDAFQIEQPVGCFYVAKINFSDLVKLASKDMSNITNNTKNNIYQRKLDNRRFPALVKYMQYSKATFPNGIILNAKENTIKGYCDGKLEIEYSENAFFIIDGQHRIEALKNYYGKKKFEICIIVFDNLEPDLQTEIFSTVNGEQKPVNPTVNLNLKGNDKEDTPNKVVRDIVFLLNSEKNSPFYKMIKTDDISKGIISMFTIAKPLLGFIYNSEDYYKIKDILIISNNSRETLRNDFNYDSKNKIFWEMYCDNCDNVLYHLMFNYFSVIKEIFSKTEVAFKDNDSKTNIVNQWNNTDYVLCKSLGYASLMMLLKDIILLKCDNNFTINKFNEILKPLNRVYKMDEIITQENYGAGVAGSRRLYKKLYELVFNEANNEAINEEDLLNYTEED